ncbi:unnamed protein product [Arabidopsis halleri]
MFVFFFDYDRIMYVCTNELNDTMKDSVFEILGISVTYNQLLK